MNIFSYILHIRQKILKPQVQKTAKKQMERFIDLYVQFWPSVCFLRIKHQTKKRSLEKKSKFLFVNEYVYLLSFK